MNSELMSVIDYWVREKGIEKETLLSVVQDCLAGAAKKAVGPARDLRCEINPRNGAIKAFAKLIVVEKVESVHDQIALAEARQINPEIQIGQEIEKEVTPDNFGRIAAQYAKQNLIQLIRRIEKSKIYSEYKVLVGEIVEGSIERIAGERGAVIVDLGRCEGIMPPEERIVSERYRKKDRVRFYLKSVEQRQNGPEIILSRADPQFLVALLRQESTEIKDGTIEIKGVAREPGVRAKVGVYSKDPRIDPVGACVGVKGQRIKNIVRELNNEKIDIVKYDEDIVRYIANALAPAKLKSYNIESEAAKTIQIWPETSTGDKEINHRSLAIGKRGINVRLTTMLTGWKVDICEDDEFSQKVENAEIALAAIPGISQEQAELLVHAGFTTASDILSADLADLQSIEGIGENATAVLEAIRANAEQQ